MWDIHPPQPPAPRKRTGGWPCDDLYFNPGKSRAIDWKLIPHDHTISPVEEAAQGIDEDIEMMNRPVRNTSHSLVITCRPIEIFDWTVLGVQGRLEQEISK